MLQHRLFYSWSMTSLCIRTKQFKECDLWPKTKIPVLVLRTDNNIPKE